MKILIAEDSLSFRTILTEMVTKWGFEPVVVEDGEAALQVMQGKDAPRLLLLDWEMPKMSGTDVCEHLRLRQDTDPPYIILITSRDETADIVEGLNKGANDYISKPVEFAELRVRLQAGQRVLDLQEELNKAKDVLTEERDIIENIINEMRSNSQFDQNNLRYLQAPVERTSGDVLFSAYCPDNTQHIMLGDFTGHGITAALGGPVVSDTFYAMTDKGLSMSLIATEINQNMCKKMPVGLFLGAIFIEVNPYRTQMSIWNCGMDEVLLFRKNSLKQTILSGHLALGVLDKPVEGQVVIDTEYGDRVYAYSDGITETISHQEEMFGQQRLVDAISEMLDAQTGIETLVDVVKVFRGEGEQLDDITLVELLC